MDEKQGKPSTMSDSRYGAVSIDVACAADAAAVAQIYAHYVRQQTATFDTEEWGADQTEKLIQCRSPEGFWVARSPQNRSPQIHSPQTFDQPSRVIGWASARRFSARPGYRFSLESSVYVQPQLCGGGTGTALMNHLFHQCQANGIHHLMARIIAKNQGSLRFHEHVGYQIVGTQEEVGRIKDRWVDVVILQKRLE